jgi:hypothetical protein
VLPETKAAFEAEVLRSVEDEDVELVVLARYMQILSPELCEALAGAPSTSTTRSCPASRAPTPTVRPTSAA